MVLRLCGLAVFLLLTGLVWLGFEEIDRLLFGLVSWAGYERVGQVRGTLLWPYRYLVLAIIAFGSLSLIQFAADHLVGRLGGLGRRKESGQKDT